MAREVKVIRVPESSELSRLLDEAALAPLVLESRGRRYRLAPETVHDDIWANYDPKAVIDGIRQAAGAWKDVDPEALKAYVYRGRDEGTRPDTRS